MLIAVESNTVDFACRLGGCHKYCKLLILGLRGLVKIVFSDYFGLLIVVVVDIRLISGDDECGIV